MTGVRRWGEPRGETITTHRKRGRLFPGLLASLVLAVVLFAPAAAYGLTSLETLGKKIYFDRALSEPYGQACSDCHLPTAGWSEPDRELPVSEGVVAGRYGGRNSPAVAYAGSSPVFQWHAMRGEYVGGQFWDGRAPDLVEQAKGPFLNPDEMNNPDAAAVVRDVRASSYASLFRKVFGKDAFNDVDAAYDKIATAIAAYEQSAEVNAFTSKFDAVMAGRASFTLREQQGMMLFRGKGACTNCHGGMGMGGMGGGGMGGMGGGGMGGGGMGAAVFTDHSYHNLGIPRNTSFLPLATAPVDLGLGGFLGEAAQRGKFKVPTLRNVAATAPYTHNGSFTSLRELIAFYNTRDLGGWPAPEVPENLSMELGALGLTEAEVDALVDFLDTLTDGYLR